MAYGSVATFCHKLKVWNTGVILHVLHSFMQALALINLWNTKKLELRKFELNGWNSMLLNLWTTKKIQSIVVLVCYIHACSGWKNTSVYN